MHTLRMQNRDLAVEHTTKSYNFSFWFPSSNTLNSNYFSYYHQILRIVNMPNGNDFSYYHQILQILPILVNIIKYSE